MRRLGFDQKAQEDASILAGQNGIAIYDSYLVALAARRQTIFLTADRKLLQRLSHIDIVKDFELYP